MPGVNLAEAMVPVLMVEIERGLNGMMYVPTEFDGTTNVWVRYDGLYDKEGKRFYHFTGKYEKEDIKATFLEYRAKDGFWTRKARHVHFPIDPKSPIKVMLK